MRPLLFTLTALGLLSGALASPAAAGSKEAAPVEVYVYPGTGSGIAYGSLGSTRSAGAATSYLGCSISADAAGGNTGECQASDGTDSIRCVLDPLNFEFHVAALRNLTASSEVVFAWETQNGQKICTYLTVSESSVSLPLQ